MTEPTTQASVTFVDLIDERDRVIGFASKEWAEKNKFAYRTAVILLTSEQGELLLRKESNEFGTFYFCTFESIVTAGNSYLQEAHSTVEKEFGMTPPLRASEYFTTRSASGFCFTQAYVGVAPTSIGTSVTHEWISPEKASSPEFRSLSSAALQKLIAQL